ncbi:MAG: mannosyltransferase [Tomitella sp.]|nr:mannosyltransferase [Tomitella sp.]
MSQPVHLPDGQDLSRPSATRATRTLDALRPWVWPLLAISVLVRVVLTVFGDTFGRLLDLHVYVEGAATMMSGDLYGFVFDDGSPGAALPFTYPPFAAIVFYPLHFIPMGLLGVIWQVLSVAALYAVVRIALRMVLGDGADAARIRTAAVLWTTAGMWVEPARVTINFGQINIFLVLLVMMAVQSRRSWLAGAWVGIAAGIKLTPAVTGLYFLARKRWSAAAWSAVAFFATIGIGMLVIGDETRQYFEDLLGDADRIGPVGASINQSLRGVLSRFAGHDLGNNWIVLLAIAVFAALCVAAWRAIGDDRLGILLLVQLVGLLASPISWNHHWVWVVPLMIWLVHGRIALLAGARWLAAVWMVVMLIGPSSVLLSSDTANGTMVGGSPVNVWLSTSNVTLAVITVVWVTCAARMASRRQARESSADAARVSGGRDG